MIRSLAASAAWSFLAMSGGGSDDKLCGVCHTTGKVPFEVPKDVVEIEKGCLYCSEVVENAAANYGFDFQACPKCQAPSLRAKVQKELDAKHQEQLDWIKSRREIDQFVDDPKGLHLMHVATPHFELAWSIPKVKVGKIVLDQHASMHLYAKRLEEFYQLYLDQFGWKHETDQKNVRHTIMCFESAKHATKCQPKYCGMGGTGITDGVKLMGIKSNFVCWWNKTKNREDSEFHEYLVHNIAHHFLCSNYNFFWLARKNGWIDEGLAHYFTDRLFHQCRTHCYQEQDEAANWIFGSWRAEVRKRVALNKIPVFAETTIKHGESLNAEEHMFVWSWVQYLNDNFDHAKFAQLVKGLKDQLPLRSLLQDLYGVSSFQFVENWKKYVMDTYPPR